MASDDRTAPRRAPAIRALAVAVLVGVGLLGSALPAYAATSTDLSVRLTNAVDAKPGKRVSYQVVVHNKGPHTARRVRIDFTTSITMRSIRYKIKNGYCYHSPRETVCAFYSGIRPGASAAVTISGVISKRLKKGTAVTNRVTLTSATHLSNTADDVATDNYRIGIPRSKPVVAPSPSANPQSKLLKIDKAAARVFGYSHTALRLTFLALGGAALWFAVGLTLRHRRRVRDEWEYEDVEPAGTTPTDTEPANAVAADTVGQPAP